MEQAPWTGLGEGAAAWSATGYPRRPNPLGGGVASGVHVTQGLVLPGSQHSSACGAGRASRCKLMNLLSICTTVELVHASVHSSNQTFTI